MEYYGLFDLEKDGILINLKNIYNSNTITCVKINNVYIFFIIIFKYFGML